MSQTKPNLLTSPEEDFIHELRHYFPSRPFSEYTTNRIKSMLERYKARDPQMTVAMPEYIVPITTVEFVIHPKQAYKPDDIILQVAKICEVEPIELKDNSRRSKLVGARIFCMYFIHKCCTITFREIGELLGDMDHSNIVKHLDNFQTFANNNQQCRARFIKLKSLFSN